MNKNKKNKKQNQKTNRKSVNHIQLYDHAGKIPAYASGDDKVYTVIQLIATTYTLTQAAVADQFFCAYFNLASLTQYTSFSTIFDQYKIDEVQVIIRPMFQSNSLGAPGAVKVPLLYTVIDYDDINTPTILDMKEYSNVTVSMYETVVIRFKPRIAVASYSGTFASFANLGNTWIDVASPGVQHYGLKVGCEGGISGQTLLQVFDISVKYKVSFRNIR